MAPAFPKPIAAAWWSASCGSSRAGPQPGSGLGLSLASAVARLHGGELKLEDNHPGLRSIIALAAGRTGGDGMRRPRGRRRAEAGNRAKPLGPPPARTAAGAVAAIRCRAVSAWLAGIKPKAAGTTLTALIREFPPLAPLLAALPKRRLSLGPHCGGRGALRAFARKRPGRGARGACSPRRATLQPRRRRRRRPR